MQQCLLKKLKDLNATPAYIFDIDQLKERVIRIRNLLAECNDSLCYAIKANPFLINEIDLYVEKFEVCSPGELHICKQNGIKMHKIVLSGVNKQESDILDALKWGVVTYTVESVSQLTLLQQCACNVGKKIDVLLRLSSGNQFGMDKEQICQVIEKKEIFSNIVVKGIQFYSGTQKKIKKIKNEIDELYDFCSSLEQLYHFRIEVIEFGPGLCVNYFGRENESNEDNLLEECKEWFAKISTRWNLVLEMGRFLVYDCGKYVTQVVDTKCNEEKKYCILDGGINHVTYYGQIVGMKIPKIKFYSCNGNEDIKEIGINSEKSEVWCLCGSLCTVADILVRSLPIENVQIGDLFVFENIGAYSVTEGIYLFLSRRLPRVYLLRQGEIELVRDACETYRLNCRAGI